MKQGTANLAEDYCFIHKALRPLGKARPQIAAVPSSNSRHLAIMLRCRAPKPSYRTKRTAGHLRVSDVICIVTHTSALKTRAHGR